MLLLSVHILQTPLGQTIVSISTTEEHGFLVQQLNKLDRQHRRWYIGALQQSANYYVNPDGTQLVNIENAFIDPDSPYGKDYLAYNFSRSLMYWGFEPVTGEEPLCFICEANIDSGRNGPFFPLRVDPHSNYQQLKFPIIFQKRSLKLPRQPSCQLQLDEEGGSLPRSASLASYNRVLNIPRVQVEDEGEYVCRAYNDRSSIENSVILSIQVSEPNFTIPLTDMHMDIMGYLEPEDQSRIKIQDNVLIISHLDDERDPGMYQCRASNTLKTSYSSAQLRVLGMCQKPLRDQIRLEKDGTVIGDGGHRRIYENGNLFINPVSRDDEGIYTCTATNELGMDESKGRLIVLPFNLKIDAGYLRIINTTFTDSGEYECVVKSAVGRIVSKTYILIEGPPGPPGGLQVMNIQKNSVTLQWTDGAHHGSPIHSYTIGGRTNWNNTWVNITHGVRATEIDRYTGRKEAIIDNVLVPWAVYEFRVAAWNNHGIGVFSAPSPRHSTPPERPFIAPYNVGVFWRRKDGEPEFQSSSLKELGNVGMVVVHILQEFFYTQYIVKVQAINDVGPGPISREVVIYSAEDMPQVPPQLVSPNPIILQPSTSAGYPWIRQERRSEASSLVTGLWFITLLVKVRKAKRFIERTFKKAPQKPPSSVRVYGVNPSTVKVVWRYVQPSLEEEPLQGFKIRVWEVDQDLSTANDTIISFGSKLEGYVPPTFLLGRPTG
ncbi:hypothetical protein NQ318_006870 [Aromia moschata]|uniref:Fibronectin type-III domain-containing protein n=1 Tax=Aromia moschata TaxID=1265417 RepID=A0AAV8YLI1_9CUCU|nr:hypothetical protein NQ318_006870 [Aromia moschata]